MCFIALLRRKDYTLHLHSRFECLLSKRSPLRPVQSKGEGSYVINPLIFFNKMKEKIIPIVALPLTKRSILNSDSCSSSLVDGSFDDFSNVARCNANNKLSS